jgi:phosphate transport system permease protein
LTNEHTFDDSLGQEVFPIISRSEQSTVGSWADVMRTPSNFLLRKVKDRSIKILSILATVLVLYPLLDMLFMFAYKGALAISIARLTESTVGSVTIGGGGLGNAIQGSLLLIGLSALFAVPIGILGGVYLAEFSNNNRFSELVRFFADVLAGVPSIVLGYVGFLLLVLYLGWGYSALAAAITLAVLMFPYILRTTELSMRRVPASIREAAIALGSTKTDMINRLTLRFAMPGILTGVLIAISISVGETAPLLYTASFSNYSPVALLHAPVGYLTYIVWTFSQLPGQDALNLAYLAAFLLILFVMLINVVARIGLKRFSRV